MNFSTRLGWSLLLFGALALVASFFGYAPRKLAHLSPGQIKIAAGVIMGAGALFLALGGDPRTRRKILVGLGAVAGVAALGLCGLFVIGYFASKRRPTPPSAPHVAPGWTPPAAPAGASPTTSPMAALHQKRSAWESRFGRDKVWGIVVHLSGTEAPAGFEDRLRDLVTKKDGGDVAVARMGNLLQAGLAPCDDASAVRETLERLFPGAQVQVNDRVMQATVFARTSSAPR